VKVTKTSEGGGEMPVRHTIPLRIVLFIVLLDMQAYDKYSMEVLIV